MKARLGTEGETSGIAVQKGIVSLLRPYQGVIGDEKHVRSQTAGLFCSVEGM